MNSTTSARGASERPKYRGKALSVVSTAPFSVGFTEAEVDLIKAVASGEYKGNRGSTRDSIAKKITLATGWSTSGHAGVPAITRFAVQQGLVTL